VKAFYNGQSSEQIAKRSKRQPTGPTHEAKLRKIGAFNRGREWFRLEVK
jgi:hypothetical protein